MTPTFCWVFLFALVGRAASMPQPLVVDACALICNPGAETESERERDPTLYPRYPKVDCNLQSDTQDSQAWVITSNCLKLCNREVSINMEVNCFALRSSLGANLGCYCEAMTPLSPNTIRLNEDWKLNFLVKELANDLLTTISQSPLDMLIICEIHKELFNTTRLVSTGPLLGCYPGSTPPIDSTLNAEPLKSADASSETQNADSKADNKKKRSIKDDLDKFTRSKRTEKSETEKSETEKSETKKSETEKSETEKSETKKSETEKSETKKSETEKSETEKSETKKSETEKSSLDETILNRESDQEKKSEKEEKKEEKKEDEKPQPTADEAKDKTPVSVKGNDEVSSSVNTDDEEFISIKDVEEESHVLIDMDKDKKPDSVNVEKDLKEDNTPDTVNVKDDKKPVTVNVEDDKTPVTANVMDDKTPVTDNIVDDKTPVTANEKEEKDDTSDFVSDAPVMSQEEVNDECEFCLPKCERLNYSGACNCVDIKLRCAEYLKAQVSRIRVSYENL